MSNPSPSQVTSLQGYTSYLSAAKTFDNGGNFYAVYYDKSLGTKQVTTMNMTLLGTLAWATNQALTGTSGEDIDPAIVLDNAGGIYVAFTSLGTTYNPNTSVGNQDITIVKYNTAGVQQWVRQKAVDISMNTVQDDLNPSLTYDTVNGALYVTYETTGATTPIGDKDIVMIKLTSAGSKVWERIMGTVAEDTAAQVTTDMCGNIVIVYNTKGVSNTTETKTSISGYDVAVAKYDTSGNLLWRRQNNTFNTTGNNLAPVATTDANGNIFCAYCVSGGTISGGSSPGGYDLVVFKLNAAGALQWARQANMWNTTANDLEPSITIDSKGYLYLAYTSLGAVSGKTNSGGTDIIVLKIDDRSGGNLVWSKQNTLNNTAYNEFQPTVCVGGSNQVFVGYLGDATDASGYTDFGILNIVDSVPSATSILSAGPAGQPTGLAAGETTLTWTGPSGTVNNYKFYNVSGDVYTLVATLPSTTTSVAYSSLTPSLVGQTWVVSAVNSNGESMYSLPVNRQVTFSDVSDGSVSAASFISQALSAGVSAADIKSALRTNIAKFTAAYNAAVGVNVNSLLDAGATLTGKTSTELAAATLNILLVTNGSSVSLSSVTNNQLLYLPTVAGDSFTVTADGSANTIAIDNSGVLSVGGSTVSAGATFLLGNSGYTYIANGGIVLYSQGLLPGAPTNVTATAGNTQATVSFTAPVSIDGVVITGYTVTSSPGGFTATGAFSPITVTGLTNGSAYTFTVIATNAAGNSVLSTASSSITPYTVPSAPTISAVDASNASVLVTFSTPANNGSAITGYTVTSSPGGKIGTGSSSPILVTDLTNGTAYTFTVKATNAAGDSAASTASTSATPYTIPDAPTSLGTSSITTTSLTLSWTAPTSNGGSALTKYIVSYGETSVDVSANVSSIAVTGLAAGTDYTFSVAAVNIAGSCATPANVSATTLKTVTDSIYNAHSVDSITYNLMSTFSIPTAGNTVRDVSTNAVVSASVSGNQLTVTGLAEYTIYTFDVDLSGFARFTTTTARTKDITAPGDVSGFEATPGNQQIVLSWNEIDQDVGSDISGYYIYEGTSSSTIFRTINPKSYTSETITSLTNGTSYIYRIAAYDADGNVGNTRAVSATPRTVPSAPTAVSASVLANQGTVSWTAPTSNGGASINYYTVTAATTDGSTSIDVSGSSSPLTVNDLIYGKAYTFKVTATNAAGTSAASTETSAIAVAGSSNLTFTQEAGTIVLSWSAVTNAASYTIYDASAGTAVASDVSGLTYTLTDKAVGTYSYNIKSKFSSGIMGPASTNTPNIVVLAKPAIPAIGTVVGASVDVSFALVTNATSYNLYNSANVLVRSGITASPVTLSDLSAGVYKYYLRGVNASGIGRASDFTRQITVLSKPSLTASVAANTISLTATPEAGSLQQPTGYSLYRANGTVVGDTSDGKFSIDASAGTYTFYAVGKNSSGISPASDSVMVKVLAAPANVTVTANGTSVDVSFGTVSNALSYTIVCLDATGKQVGLVRGVTASPYTLGDQPIGALTYRVRAVNASGVGPFSSDASVTVLSNAALGTNVDSTTITLTAVSDSTATGYSLYRGSDDALLDSSSGRIFTLTNQSTGSQTFYVRKVAGSNSLSAKSGTASLTVFGAPAGVTATVDGNSATVSCNAVSGASTYVIYAGGDKVTDSSSPTFTLTGLLPKTYSYTVRAGSGTSLGPASSPVTVTILAAPTDVSVSAVGTTATVTFRPISTTATYTYQLRSGNSTVATVDASGSLGTLTVTGLAAGTTATYAVRATTGVTSTTVSVPILAAPTIASADLSGENTAIVAFSTVTGATAYRIYDGASLVATVSASPVILTDLMAGAHVYTVVATTTTSISATSASATVTIAPPAAATDLTAVGTGLTAVGTTLSWTAPVFSPVAITGYRVYTVVGSVYTPFRYVVGTSTENLVPAFGSASTTYVVASVAATGESSYTNSVTINIALTDAASASIPTGAYFQTALSTTDTVDATAFKQTLRDNIAKFESTVVTNVNMDITKILDISGTTKTELANKTVSVVLYDPSSNSASTPIDMSTVPDDPKSVVYFPTIAGDNMYLTFGGIPYAFAFDVSGKVNISDITDINNPVPLSGNPYYPGAKITLGGKNFIYAASGSIVLQNTVPPLNEAGVSVTVSGHNVTYTYTPVNGVNGYVVVDASGLTEIGATEGQDVSSLTITVNPGVYTSYGIGAYVTAGSDKNVSDPLVLKTFVVLGPPTINSATVNSGSVSIAFTGVDNATSYTLYDDTTVVATGITTSPYTYTPSAGSHSYTMSAVNSTYGSSTSVASNTVAAATLAAPTVSQFTAGTTTFVTCSDISMGLTGVNYVLYDSADVVVVSSASRIFSFTPMAGTSYKVRGSKDGNPGPASALFTPVIVNQPTLSTSVNGTTIDLSFNPVSGATAYSLYDASGDTKLQDVSAGANFASLTGKTAGTYSYYMYAFNGTNSSLASNTQYATVLSAPTISASVITTTVTFVIDSLDANADGFKIYENTTIVGTVSTQEVSGSYVLTNVTAGSHTYYVRATNGSELGPASTTTTISVLGAPTGLATDASGLGTKITFTGSGGAYYKLYKNGVFDISGTATSFAVTEAGSYQITAVSGNTESALSSTVTVLAAPTNVNTSVASLIVNFTYNSVAGAIGYKIYRSTAADGTYTAATYNTNVIQPANTTYYYVVRVYSVNGDGLASSPVVSATTAAGSGDIVPCFFANAPVLTPTGYQKISHLAVGELVVTGDGRHVPIQRIKVTQVAAGPNTNPYVIQRGHFGAVRRLLISPNHKVITADGPVEAKDLGLRQEEHNGMLTYYNIELPDHARDTMVVAGVIVESLAPVRRVAVTMSQFTALIARKHGTEITPQVLANIERTCWLLPDGRVEVPVLRR